MEYQVELEAFHGPLDLLLFLVKHHEVDIFDIPIAKVTDQFLAYLNVIRQVDMEWAGEFLVMAATLMEIKSKMLLPHSEQEEAEKDDPRLELVRQLIEYKKFKEAAALLEAQAEKQLTRLPRLPLEMPGPLDPAQQPLHRVELWDLVSAFGRLMRETLALQPQQIVLDETPLQVHMDNIVALLAEKGRLAFSEIFQPPHTRGRLVGMFLAILELIKGRKICAEQAESFADIWIVPAPEEEPAREEGIDPSSVPLLDGRHEH